MRDESRDLLLDSEDVRKAVIGKEDVVFVREASREWGPGAGNPNSTGVRYVPFGQYQRLEAIVRNLIQPIANAREQGLLMTIDAAELSELEGIVL